MKKYKKKPNPPKTKRPCPVCEEETKFEYDRVVGHSSCSICGYRKINLKVNKAGKQYAFEHKGNPKLWKNKK